MIDFTTTTAAPSPPPTPATAGRIKYAGPVSAAGDVEIYSGDAVTLAWSIDAYAGSAIDGENLSMRFVPLEEYWGDSNQPKAAVEVQGNAVLANGSLLVSLAMLPAETALLSAGAEGNGTTKYRCQVIATDAQETLLDVLAVARRRAIV